MTRVVFLHPRRMRRTYRADAVTALYRAALAEAGLETARLDLLLDQPESEAARLAELTGRLRSLGARLAVVEHGFSQPFLAAVRAGGVVHVLALGRPSEVLRPGIDSAAAWPSSDALVRLARAVLAGRALACLPGVWLRAGGAVVEPERPDPFAAPAELAQRLPEWRGEECLGAPDEPLSRDGSVVVDLGCAWRTRRPDPPVLRGVPRPAGVPGAGCTFCERAAATPLAPGARMDLVLKQARRLVEQRPSVTRVQLVDEALFGWVDRFAIALARADLPPLDWLVSGRPDLFLKHVARLETALARLPAGHRLVLFCLGVESFSARELSLYNKGFGPDTNLRALNALEELRARHPALGVEPSFGFILWNPWTRLPDLVANLKALRATRFTRYRQGVLHTRLRLYPEVPLYWRARADGLLGGDADRGEAAAPDFGYGDAPWRFADPRVARLHQAMLEAHLGGDDVDSLARLLVEATSRPPGRGSLPTSRPG